MEYILLAADALVVSTLYVFYKAKTKNLNNVKKAVEFDPKLNSLKPGEAVDYAMVVGKVKPDGLVLESHFNKSMSGVIQVLQIKEHRTRLQNSFVSDTERIISRVVNHEPFSLINESLKVQVDQPLKADYILENLNLTHTFFEPNKDSALAKVLSVVMTDQHARGHETTEYMLPAGRVMTAFGRIERIPDTSMIGSLNLNSTPLYRISPPSLSGHSYIVSSLSKDEIIDELKSTSKILKVSLIIFGSVGAMIAAYCIYDRVSKYLAKRNQERLLAQAREHRLQERQRRQQQETQNAEQNNENQPSSTCVVCLTNPREVVLIDCGHVCLCTDCLESMPNRTCPICRRPFTSFVPCFIP